MLDFEKAFGDFIDRREYDQAANALFSMVRIAFTAGWLAAGGNPPKPQPVFQLIFPDRKILSEDQVDDIETDITLDEK